MSVRHRLFGILRAASLLMILVTLGLLSAIITMHFVIHGAEVKVPTLKGMTVADARSQTSGLGLQLEVDNRYYSSDVAAGHILTQSPAPGTVVRREWHVRVSESLGPQKVEVPNAVGVDERVAALKLRRVGLAVGATVKLPVANVPEGLVLAQDPPPHAQGIEGPSINLLVAAPTDERPDGFVMPDLSNMTEASAEAMLDRIGLKLAPTAYVDVGVPQVGEGMTPPVTVHAPGSVLQQYPPAGARVDQSTQIKLTVVR